MSEAKSHERSESDERSESHKQSESHEAAKPPSPIGSATVATGANTTQSSPRSQRK